MSSTLCGHCGRSPAENEHFSTCARCKLAVYCSRQCQKGDWPNHKLWCTHEEKQFTFVFKRAMRMNEDDGFLQSLRLALSEEFYETFTTTPNPRKIWVAALHFCLRPHKLEDVNALYSLDVSLDSLFEKPMVGCLKIFAVADVSNLEKYPLEDRKHTAWREYRDVMDKAGLVESHVVLVRFLYRNQDFYFLPIDVHKQDLLQAEVSRLQDEIGRLRGDSDDETGGLNPGLDQINMAIILEDAASKKFRCMLGDDDKRVMRGWAMNAAIARQEVTR